MSTALLILVRPLMTLRRLKESPSWIAPFLLLALIALLLFSLEAPRTIQSTLDHLPESASSSDRQAVADDLERDIAARAAFLPVRLLLAWSSFALLLHWGARAFGSEGRHRYRHMLALEVHAESALTVGSLATAAGIPLPSLALLADAQRDFLLNSLLGSVNLSTLWYAVILTAGMTVLCHHGKLKAFLIVAGSWGIVQALNVGVLNLVRHTFHFFL